MAPAAGALRAARVTRGWSQSQAARELAALGRDAGAAVAAPASLKTLLSRWENGHALPEAQYRELLAELYGRTPAELGIDAAPADPDAASAPERLRTALAAAAAVRGPGLELWREQVDLAARLDDELGGAGAGELVGALVTQLDHTLVHATTRDLRGGLAALLARVAAIAGTQELDRSRPDVAWRRYERARTAAEEADSPRAAAVATAGQAAVLVEVGEAAAAVELVDAAAPRFAGHEHWHGRLAAAKAMAAAAAGDAHAARAALAAADRAAQEMRADVVTPADGPGLELADLERWHGRALVTLGDPAAVGHLERALAAPPRAVRHRAVLHADLALALAERRPDVAAGHARTARELADRIGSTRIRTRLTPLIAGG